MSAAQEFHHVREKIVELKKKKMVEELGLEGEEARKFLDIYAVHIDQMHQLHRQRKELSKKLKHMAAIGYDVPGDRILQTISELNKVDETMLQERNKTMIKMEGILNPPLMAKYVLFEMRFDDKLRETLMFIRHKRPKERPPWEFFEEPLDTEQ
jgi:hypothetical protein